MKTRRPWLTVVLALFWSVATIGFSQFLFSWTRPVVPESSSLFFDWTAWDQLTCWLLSGCGRPSGDPWPWLGWTGGVSVLLAVLTLRSLPPIRTWRRKRKMRLRRLMAMVAVSAFAYVGGRETWDAWGRWNRYAQAAEHCAAMEVLSGDYESEIPVGLSDEKRREWIEASLANQESFRQAKETYQRAMWRPWVRVSVDVPLW